MSAQESGLVVASHISERRPFVDTSVVTYSCDGLHRENGRSGRDLQNFCRACVAGKIMEVFVGDRIGCLSRPIEWSLFCAMPN